MERPRSAGVAEVLQPLNLLALARTGSGQAQAVPGTEFEVAYYASARAETTGRALWLLLLSGKLIIDLPHGDFRIMNPGEALWLPAGLELSYKPLEESVLLRSSPG